MQHIINAKLSGTLAVAALTFGFALPAFAESPYQPLENNYENLEIKIEIEDDSTKVEYSYENEEGDEKEGSYEYGTNDLDEVYEKLTEKFDLSLDEVKDAVIEIEGEENDSSDDESTSEEDARDAIDDAEDAIQKAEDFIADLDDEDDIEDAEALLLKAETKLADAEEFFDDENFDDAEEWAEKAEDVAKSIYEDGDDDKEDADRGHGNDKDGCDEDNAGKSKRCDAPKSDDKKDWKRENLSERFKDFGKSDDKEVLNAQLRELLLILIDLLRAQAKLGN